MPSIHTPAQPSPRTILCRPAQKRVCLSGGAAALWGKAPRVSVGHRLPPILPRFSRPAAISAATEPKGLSLMEPKRSGAALSVIPLFLSFLWRLWVFASPVPHILPTAPVLLHIPPHSVRTHVWPIRQESQPVNPDFVPVNSQTNTLFSLRNGTVPSRYPSAP